MPTTKQKEYNHEDTMEDNFNNWTNVDVIYRKRKNIVKVNSL